MKNQLYSIFIGLILVMGAGMPSLHATNPRLTESLQVVLTFMNDNKNALQSLKKRQEAIYKEMSDLKQKVDEAKERSKTFYQQARLLNDISNANYKNGDAVEYKICVPFDRNRLFLLPGENPTEQENSRKYTVWQLLKKPFMQHQKEADSLVREVDSILKEISNLKQLKKTDGNNMKRFGNFKENKSQDLKDALNFVNAIDLKELDAKEKELKERKKEMEEIGTTAWIAIKKGLLKDITAKKVSDYNKLSLDDVPVLQDKDIEILKKKVGESYPRLGTINILRKAIYKQYEQVKGGTENLKHVLTNSIELPNEDAEYIMRFIFLCKQFEELKSVNNPYMSKTLKDLVESIDEILLVVGDGSVYYDKERIVLPLSVITGYLQYIQETVDKYYNKQVKKEEAFLSHYKHTIELAGAEVTIELMKERDIIMPFSSSFNTLIDTYEIKKDYVALAKQADQADDSKSAEKPSDTESLNNDKGSKGLNFLNQNADSIIIEQNKETGLEESSEKPNNASKTEESSGPSLPLLVGVVFVAGFSAFSAWFLHRQGKKNGRTIESKK